MKKKKNSGHVVLNFFFAIFIRVHDRWREGCTGIHYAHLLPQTSSFLIFRGKGEGQQEVDINKGQGNSWETASGIL